jgi:hypothetical protein
MTIKKRKTESDIRIFKDCDLTVGELRNPEDIGIKEMNMHLARFSVILGLGIMGTKPITVC